MGSIDTCKECGKQLKKIKHERLSQKVCNDCKGEYRSVNKYAREIFKEMQENPTEPAEDEIWFEDSPVALREEEYGRVVKNATSSTSYGMSPLAEIMSASDTNKYRPTHGSATNGTRYTYKKREM
jgi:ribosome-binding protein aMBF1 (putative translation factor)